MWLDNASSVDMLFYSPYADTVVKFAKNNTLTPLTIGLYGSWGAGKSSLLNLIEKKLAELGEDEKVACVSLNAWQFEGYEDAKIAIMESLLKSLNDNKAFTEKAEGKIKGLLKRIDFLKLGKNVVKTGLPYALGALTGNPLPIALNFSATLSDPKRIVERIADFKNEYVKPPEDDSEIENVRKFREEFEQMLNDVDSVSNLAVIIDDLDRCTPDRIIDTLEAIKLFLSVKKTTFIIAVDQRIIEYAVKTKYNKIDGYEISADYIEKIIQLPIKIPELSPKDIENYLLLLICQLHIHSEEFQKLIDYVYSQRILLEERAIEFSWIEEYILSQGFEGYCDNLEEFKNDAHTIERIREVVSPSLKGNPRQTKRFLNAFFVRKNLSALYFGNELDIAIIAKLLALEIIDLDLFKEINEWNKDYCGENSQLKKLEMFANAPSDCDDGKLIKWLVKRRIIEWLLSEPKELYKQDLSKYFYLSRESLINSESTSAVFTEEERKLLNRIIDCIAGQEESRINELASISAASRARVLEEILNKFRTEGIEIRIIASIFTNYPEYQNEICDIIKTNTSIVINFGSVPHLKRMYKANMDTMSDLLEYLVSRNRMKNDEKRLIEEDESPVVKAIERN